MNILFNYYYCLERPRSAPGFATSQLSSYEYSRAFEGNIVRGNQYRWGGDHSFEPERSSADYIIEQFKYQQQVFHEMNFKHKQYYRILH